MLVWWFYLFSGGPLALVLHEVQLDLVDPAVCKHVLQTLKLGQDRFTVLCAGPEQGGKDACQVENHYPGPHGAQPF